MSYYLKRIKSQLQKFVSNLAGYWKFQNNVGALNMTLASDALATAFTYSLNITHRTKYVPTYR